jgi:hypothetical protein
LSNQLDDMWAQALAGEAGDDLRALAAALAPGMPVDQALAAALRELMAAQHLPPDQASAALAPLLERLRAVPGAIGEAADQAHGGLTGRADLQDVADALNERFAWLEEARQAAEASRVRAEVAAAVQVPAVTPLVDPTSVQPLPSLDLAQLLNKR